MKKVLISKVETGDSCYYIDVDGRKHELVVEAHKADGVQVYDMYTATEYWLSRFNKVLVVA